METIASLLPAELGAQLGLETLRAPSFLKWRRFDMSDLPGRAMVHARIRRLVYGADDPKAGAVRSVMHVLDHLQLNHKVEVRSGVLAGRSAELLQAFFRSRR